MRGSNRLALRFASVPRRPAAILREGRVGRLGDEVAVVVRGEAAERVDPARLRGPSILLPVLEALEASRRLVRRVRLRRDPSYVRA